MNGRFIRTTVILVALVLAGGAWAHAQPPVVKVGFPFLAAGRTLNAGSYSVELASSGNIVLTPEQGGPAVEVPQLKAISRRDVKRAQLVFDVVGSARFLSEVWLSGNGGILVGRQSDAAAREFVNGPKPQK